uniref:Non-specific protein-tyrosine kinase n=1 Tax=Amphimedon queenslandica TaxID=400682 RepID=A0A1X7TK65_AMPQE
MSSIRNKHGSLQMYKGKKWKTYSFKVTGSTYLHYFGESKASEPKDQIFLTTVSAVEVPPKAPKNGSFVFEVRHSGKSSPWILSADSEEERRDWMETIKPNSTTMLHSSQIKDIHQRNKTILNRGGPPSPQPGHQYGNGSATMGTSRSPSMYQRSSLQYSATVRNTHTGATQGRNYSEPAVQPYPHNNPQFLSLGRAGGAYVGGGESYQVTQSLPSSPSLSPPSPIPLTPPGVQPRPPETQPRPHETEPQPLQRPMSMSDRPPMPEPRQLIMAGPPAEYLDPLQLNMPAGSKRIIEDNDGGTCPVTPSGDEPTPTGNQYLLIAPPSKTRPDHKETCLLKDRSKPNTPQSPPVCVTPPTSPATIDPIFETLKSQFTASQIQALVEMLAKMNDKGGGGGEANVGYLVTKTANTLNESMLVTEDDDPDHYNERPKWAKAINEQVTDNSEPLLPDASTVNIPRTSLTNMNRIGAGHFGDVFSADYTPEGFGPEDSIKVAVKTAKKGVTEGKRKEILREVSVMTNMVHPNLVRLYGTNEEDGLPWLVLEYLPHGDLKHYLQNSPTKKSPDSLVKYMVDVAMGMHYIAERGLVHRFDFVLFKNILYLYSNRI